ncbi:putative Type 1 galactoside alpha-(1,2)-fucosyltransferase [Rosa chinensis]|uniref:Fucosyltransferase n=1 Tax=Rosa chinensis TaxID=74649 RepID=A0A2P6R2T2_ROSCH|nr:putative Type 1 galactoside alpha-(1,2)-fucosyltransferase [Rosa chinensis]
MDQILACAFNEKLLPLVEKNKPIVTTPLNPKLKSILITCLLPECFKKMRNMYSEYPTLTGDIIAVFQPTHEEHQKTDGVHDRKTSAEILLLSFSNVLVTSAESTFGYVAQSVLFIPENQMV